MTCKQHEYAGGYCIHCLDPQENLNYKIVKVRPDYKPTKKKITSEFQYKVDSLITFLGVPVKEFPKFARHVKKIGPENVHKIIKEIEGADKWCRETHHEPLNKIGFFINKYVKKKSVDKSTG